MKNARLQTNDLGRTEQFFNTLLSKQDFKEAEKSSIQAAPKSSQLNGASLPFKLEAKPRFSDPPAPPPQQPLPEKPDVSRPHGFDPTSPSLKRSITERPRSVPIVSPDRSEQSSQIISLVEALESAKKEISAQSSRMRDLEDMLQKEREARETAEGLAKQFGLEPSAKMNGFVKGGADESILEEAFEPPPETSSEKAISDFSSPKEPSTGIHSVEASTAELQERLELMMNEMREMKEHMESYRQRAEKAEAERDTDRKTLAEMVQKIRYDEARRSSSTERPHSPSKDLRTLGDQLHDNTGNPSLAPLSISQGDDLRKSSLGDPADVAVLKNSLAMALPRPPGTQAHLLYESAPYASMLGVVLLGMGLMAYMNGWQKVER